MGRLRDYAARFWSHCTGPVTVRSIVFIAVMILFLWALFDRLAVKDQNRAMQHKLELYSVETQQGLNQIHTSWAKFDAAQEQILTNQRAMQDEINAQTAILHAEKAIREKELTRPSPQPSQSRGASRSRARSSRLRSCYRLEDRVKTFGNGAEVKQQILVSVPCP